MTTEKDDAGHGEMSAAKTAAVCAPDNRGVLRKAFMAVLAIGFLAASDVRADGLQGYGAEDGLVRLGDRWFDLRVPAPVAFTSGTYIAPTRIPWLRRAILSEPSLSEGRRAIDLRIIHDPDGVEDVFDPGRFPGMTLIRSRKQTTLPEGYALWRSATGRMTMTLPKGRNPREAAVCILGSGTTVAACRVYAAYPDERIVVQTSYPGLHMFEDFAPRIPEIAARIREIALCLDVTEDVARGDWRPSQPAESISETCRPMATGGAEGG